jgi:hypothetical protein
MPAECPDDNRVYCKAYYERTKQDPRKLAALRERRARNQRERRARRVATGSAVAPVNREPETPVNPPVTSLGGKHAPPVTQGGFPMSMEDIIREWHGRWADDLMG